MNKHTIVPLALIVGSSTLSLAADSSTAPFSLGNWAKDSFKLFDAKRDHAENPWIQEVSLKLRGQYQWGYVDPTGGGDRVKGASVGNSRRDNNEWRRLRLGAQAKFLNRFTLKGVWNIGGVDTREKFSKGQWGRSRSEGTLDELVLSGNFAPVTINVGKHKPAYMGEYRTSSAKLITMERSFIVNQLKAEKLYGISAQNSNSKDTWGWNVGAWFNGQHDGTWQEPALNTGDNVMLGASVSYATSDKSRLYLDYMHSFRNEGREEPNSEYAGCGAQDVVSLTWEAKQGKLNLMAEAIGGFNLYQEDAENVFGLVLMPSYRFTPNWEGVLRYQISSGSNAAVTDSRYYTTNSTYASGSDLLQGVYAGVNYYVCPENPHMLKLMLGAEYLNSEGTNAKGEKGFTGWQFSSAVRFDF